MLRSLSNALEGRRRSLLLEVCPSLLSLGLLLHLTVDGVLLGQDILQILLRHGGLVRVQNINDLAAAEGNAAAAAAAAASSGSAEGRPADERMKQRQSEQRDDEKRSSRWSRAAVQMTAHTSNNKQRHASASALAWLLLALLQRRRSRCVRNLFSLTICLRLSRRLVITLRVRMVTLMVRM